MKECNGCHTLKNENQFCWSWKIKGIKSNYCKECRKLRRLNNLIKNPNLEKDSSAEWRLKNPEKLDAQAVKRYADPIKREKMLISNKKSVIKRKGLSIDQFNELLISQGGVCAICGNKPGDKRLAIDHDHSCCPGERSCGKCVRGLLCGRCNGGLGLFNDNINLFKQIFKYLGKPLLHQPSLSFDDVLLEPQFSKIVTRKDVDIRVKLGPLVLNHGVILANMKSVVGATIGKEITDSGGLFIMHRFCSLDEQLAALKNASGINKFISASVGVKEEDKANVIKLWESGVRIFTIDIAHGHSQNCIDMIKWLKDGFNPLVIAGNIATYAGASQLFNAGADIVKVGVGPGSICTTRIKTGCGVPQLTALMDVAKLRAEMYPERGIIADGGIRSSGDLVKALCLADAAMVGNLFAGCLETPGESKLIDGISYKKYEGSSTYKNIYIEGVKGWVALSGSYREKLNELLDGIRSGCSYQGVGRVIDLQIKPQFIPIGPFSFTESHPHDIKLV